MAQRETTDDFNQCASYVYDPLPTDDSIRLLRILPGASDTPLKCHLKVAPLSDQPTFDALSYAWGDPTLTQSIFILDDHDSTKGAKELRIASQLHIALRHLRTLDQETIIWADAVCINQPDIAERTAQVQLMAKLFSSAREVLAWIGEEDAHSRSAFQWAKQSISVLEYPMDDHTEISAIDISPPEMDCALDKTFSGNHRPFWQRLWILQEVLLAQEVTLVCGHSRLPLLPVINAVWMFYKQVQWKFAKGEGRRDRRYISQAAAVAHLFITASEQVRSKNTLSGLLQWLPDMKCSDPRDRVYALVSLCDENLRPVVDYKKTRRQVFTDAVAVMVQELHSLWPITHFWAQWGRLPAGTTGRWTESVQDGSAAELPTWLPALDHELYSHGKTYLFRGNYKEHPAYLDHPDIMGHFRSGVLKLTGILFDHVQYDHPSFRGTLSSDVFRAWSPIQTIAKESRDSEEVQRAWLEALVQAVSVISSQSEVHRYVSLQQDETRMQELWETFQECTHGPGAEWLGQVPDTFEESSVILDALYSMNGDGWRLCRTVKGHFGWVQASAIVGGEIMFVEGAHVPFVLRHTKVDEAVEEANGRAYTMNGICHFPELQDSTMLEDVEAGRRHRQTFLLY